MNALLSGTLLRSVPFVLSLLLAACSDNDPDAPGVAVIARPLGVETACTLVLTPARAAPGERIVVSGIPEDFAEPGLRVIARGNDGDTVMAAYFEQPESGAPDRFVAPLHPTTPLQGGEVLIEIGDGHRRCPPQSLTLSGLPEADPERLTLMTNKLAQWVDLNIRAVGADPDVLATADADSIEPGLIPFAVAKRLLAEDGASGWLQQQVAATVAAGDRIAVGVLTLAGFEAELDRAIAELSAIPIPVRMPAVAAVAKKAMIAGAKNRLCEGQQFPANPLPITSTADLSQRLLAAAGGGVYQNGAYGQLLGTIGLAAGTEASSGPHAFTNSANAALGANVLGTKLYLLKTVEAARRALEPTQIDSFQVRSAETLLVEDRPANQPGRWEGASILASGQAFNISPAILDGLITTVGMVPGPIGVVVGAGSTAFANPIGNVVNELTRESCMRIEAPRYGPFDVSDEEWTTSEITGDAVARIDHRRYRAAAIGSAELEIRLRGEKFGVLGVHHEQRFNIVINPQILSLLPGGMRLREPGELITLSATIANSEAGPSGPSNIGARIASLGEHDLRNTRIEGDLLSIDVQTSNRREDYPLRVEFKPLNPTLPGGGARERVAVIDIGGALTLSKSGGNGCLLPDTEVELTATLQGFAANERDVQVQVSGGSLVSHANNLESQRIVVRTGAAGTLTVRATARADSQASDEVVLPVLRTCLRKIQYSGGAFRAGGIGTDSDGGDGCPPSSEVEVQSTEREIDTERIVLPPDIPPESELWFERSERISADFVTDFTVNREGEGRCRTATYKGSTQGDLRFYGNEDGTLGMRMQADLKGNCRNEGDDLDGCSGGVAAGSISGFSYFDVTEDTPVRVEGELRCAGLSGFVELSRFTGIAIRYENGTTPYVPIGANADSLIRNEDGSERVPVLWLLECTQAGQVIPFAETIIFKKPRQQGGKDLVVVQTGGYASFQINGITKSHFGPLIDPENPQPYPQASSGAYASKGEVDFRVRLAPQ